MQEQLPDILELERKIDEALLETAKSCGINMNKLNISELERRIEEIILSKAKLYIANKDFEPAAKIYKELGYSNKVKKLYKLVAKRKLDEGDLEGAATYYEYAGEPEDLKKAVRLWEKYARKLIESRNLIDASDIYESTIARIYKKLNDMEGVKNALIKAGDLYMEIKGSLPWPLGPTWYTGLNSFILAAQYYREAGESEKAKEAAKKAIKNLVSVLIWMIFNYITNGNLIFKMLFTKDKIPERCEDIAKIYETYLEDPKKAKIFYRLAAKMARILGLNRYAAKLYEKAGDLEKTLELLEKLAEEKKDEFPAVTADLYVEIARLYKKLNKGEKMIKETLMKALDLYIKEECWGSAANVCEMLGDFEKAKWYRKKYIEKYIEELRYDASSTSDLHKRAVIHKVIAETYEEKLKDPKKAMEDWKISGIFYVESGLKDFNDGYIDKWKCASAAEAFEKTGDLRIAKKLWLLAAIDSLRTSIYTTSTKKEGCYIVAADFLMHAKRIKINT